MRLPEDIGLPSVEDQVANDLASIEKTNPALAEALRRVSEQNRQNNNVQQQEQPLSAFTKEQMADAQKHDLFHRLRLGDDF